MPCRANQVRAVGCTDLSRTRPSAITRAAAASRNGSSSGAMFAGWACATDTAIGSAVRPNLATTGRRYSGPLQRFVGRHFSTQGASTSTGPCVSSRPACQRLGLFRVSAASAPQSVDSSRSHPVDSVRAQCSCSPACQANFGASSGCSPSSTRGVRGVRLRAHGGETSNAGSASAAASAARSWAPSSVRTNSAVALSSCGSSSDRRALFSVTWVLRSCRAAGAFLPSLSAAAASSRTARAG